MRVYLDNCAYNRPFDDKEQLTIEMESAAKLHIQDEIRSGKYDLIWSYMNEYENNDNPYEDKREAIKVWEKIAKQVCAPNDSILARGKEMQKVKVKPKDSLHISCAIESGCEYFITTDIPLLKKKALFSELKIEVVAKYQILQLQPLKMQFRSPQGEKLCKSQCKITNFALARL